MTANEMRAKFLLLYEGARLANRTFNDREISDFLSKAELEFVQQRFDALKNRTRRGYGDGVIRDAELSGLTSAAKKYYKTYTINGTVYNDDGTNSPVNPFLAGTKNNGALRRPDLDNNTTSTGEEPQDHFGIFVALPDEAMYILEESCDTVKDTCQKYNIDVLPITYQYYRKGIYDPYAKPYDNLVWALDWGAFTPNDVGDGTNESTKSYTISGSGSNMTGDSTPYYDGATSDATETIIINSNRARHLIAGKGWDIVGYNVHYIVRPKGIKVDVQTPGNQINSILPSDTHQQIVDAAVRLASASIVPEQGKYQVNQVESKEDE